MIRIPAWLVGFVMLVGLATSAAVARPPAGTCFAVVARSQALSGLPPVRCSGNPEHYHDRRLWLRLPVPADIKQAGGALVVHNTRLRQMSIVFVYPDGSTETQTVGQGAFGDHWHIGGQIAFLSRPAQPVAGVWMRIEGLESYDLLRIRFATDEALGKQFEVMALAIGAALALLAIAAIYNLGLAIALRRRFFLWHGCWAASVLVWGILWSQIELGMFPRLAGTVSGRLTTMLACLAILFASFCVGNALRPALPALTRRWIGTMGLAVAVIGLLASLPGADLDVLGEFLGAATLLTLVSVTIAICWAWRRGYVEARHLFIAWIGPMVMLGATQVIDFNTVLWGGGAQIAVLFASALQIICLSALATWRLNVLRIERDAALAAGTRLAELADRDALTGLLNRRGFVDRCKLTFGDLKTTPFGLLLIDVDQFKSVNDRFGHEAGDAVLVTLARKLLSLEKQYLCLAGRLGGEEFVVGVSGMPAYALRQLAEIVRDSLGACDHGAVLQHHLVTVSIGVAEGAADGPFRTLYGKADRALYDAKQSGRNKVVFASVASAISDRQFALPLKPEN